jgi:hypothetical protein
MTRTEAIAQIQASLTELSAEQLAALAELAQSWKQPTPPEDADTRAAIAQGIAQAKRGEFATDAEVEAAFARFRT